MTKMYPGYLRALLI